MPFTKGALMPLAKIGTCGSCLYWLKGESDNSVLGKCSSTPSEHHGTYPRCDQSCRFYARAAAIPTTADMEKPLIADQKMWVSGEFVEGTHKVRLRLHTGSEPPLFINGAPARDTPNCQYLCPIDPALLLGEYPEPGTCIEVAFQQKW
jgi:hypothetical protein